MITLKVRRLHGKGFRFETVSEEKWMAYRNGKMPTMLHTLQDYDDKTQKQQ